jgi:hypothetical protein
MLEELFGLVQFELPRKSGLLTEDGGLMVGAAVLLPIWPIGVTLPLLPVPDVD